MNCISAGLATTAQHLLHFKHTIIFTSAS